MRTKTILYMFLCGFLGTALTAGAEIQWSGAAKSLSPAAKSRVRSFKSPARKITFNLNLEKRSDVQIDIYNGADERVATLKKKMPAGPGTLVWDLGDIEPGTFQAKVSIDGKARKTRLTLAP